MTGNEEMHQFLNRVRSLWSIDGYLLRDALTEEQRHEFMRDPVRYFAHTDRKQAEAIWREVQKRQRV